MTSPLSRTWTAIITVLLLLVQPASAGNFSSAAGSFLTARPVAAFLFGAGVVFLVLSVLTMGAGVAEVACFCSFTLLFMGRYLQGEELWLPLGLFAAGMLLAALEVFVIPGLGICGTLSLVSFAGLSVLLMDSPRDGLTIFFGSALLSVVSGFLVMKFLPHICITRKMFVLEPPTPTAAKPAAPDVMSVKAGDVGKADTPLRPSGMVMFGIERVDVVSEGEFVKKGTAVEVVRVEGHKVVVRTCSTPSHS